MSEFEKLLEKEADKFAYDKTKILTFSERIFAYQGFLAGAEHLLKITNIKPDTNKKNNDK